MTTLPDSVKEEILRELEHVGCAQLKHRTGPCFLVRDSQTGVLHESLSDQTCFFMPSMENEYKEFCGIPSDEPIKLSRPGLNARRPGGSRAED